MSELKDLEASLQKIATGPEYSKNLSFDEAHQAMRFILSGQADPVQIGVFFIALRMKRETDAENAGILQALLDCTQQTQVDVDELIDIADPYDGWLRGLPLSAFVPAILAACGLPAVSHGVATLAPKYGVTTELVLQAAGVNTSLNTELAASALADPNLGWAYINQQQFCQPLHALQDLRKRIVKRPVLTTLETSLQPLRGQNATYLLTGYVHKAYPSVYLQLAKQAGYQSAGVVRGVEGGVTPSLQQQARLHYYLSQGQNQEAVLDPSTLSLAHEQRCLPVDGQLHADLKTIAQAAADAGLAALAGQAGPAMDSLIYTSAIALFIAGQVKTIEAAAELSKTNILNGQAKERFLAACD